MTKILHRDPDRRCKPLEEWPTVDRELWRAALIPGDLFDDGGSRAGHSEYSNRNAVWGYGRWLTFLDRQGLLDTTTPADRITRARVNADLADLEQHNSTQTLLNRLQELHAVAVVMGPDRDQRWLYNMYAQIQSRHRPARPKRARLAPAGALFDLGIDLMSAAQKERTSCARALVYRDGLIIGPLASRPLRRRNLASLVLDRTLVRRGSLWWIEFSAEETKTKEIIELPWPEPLLEPLEIYLATDRLILAGFCRRATPRGGALWLSKQGQAMSRATIYRCVITRTRVAFGQPINPHLFRDCAATSIAIDDTEHVGITSCLLGHSSATTEKYYNQARAVEASHRWQNALLSLRRQSAL